MAKKKVGSGSSSAKKAPSASGKGRTVKISKSKDLGEFRGGYKPAKKAQPGTPPSGPAGASSASNDPKGGSTGAAGTSRDQA
jgi:hypothetical protein